MSNKVLEHIARKHLNVREGVKSVMGGKILEYEAKAILMKGFEQGKEEGIQQGIEQGKEEGIQQGIEQGKEEGIEQGIEQGMAQGIKKGKLETYIELIRDGFITLKEVANRLNMNEEDLKAQMK